MERLSDLGTTKACGPDKIPAHLLKECSEQIAPRMCSLVNHSLSLGQIPLEQKSADFTLIHKKDSKEAAKNYRPISLLYSQLLAKFWSAAWAIDFTII